MQINTDTGLVDQANYIASPNYDEREDSEPEVIIVHCISLPPGEYATGAIEQLFTNQLLADQHPFFPDIVRLKVSSHFVIDREGRLTQYVPTHLRAWHAGQSVCLGRPKVNDFSIGIELEGLDTDPAGFTDQQYSVLNQLIIALRQTYREIAATNVFSHSDIASGRKPDPGPFFDWNRVTLDLDEMSNNDH